MENITSKIKILLDGINNRLETAQVKMSEFEDLNRNYLLRSTERKNTEKNSQSLSELWVNIKSLSINIIGISKGKGR